MEVNHFLSLSVPERTVTGIGSLSFVLVPVFDGSLVLPKPFPGIVAARHKLRIARRPSIGLARKNMDDSCKEKIVKTDNHHEGIHNIQSKSTRGRVLKNIIVYQSCILILSEFASW